MASERDGLAFGGVSQKEFLAAVRSRMRPSGERPGYPEFARLWPEGEEGRLTLDEKANLFLERLEALGGTAVRAATAREAYEWTARFLREREVTRVLLGAGDWSEIGSIFESQGIATDRWEETGFEFGTADRSPERVNAWGAGLTWVDYAAAELGSVAVCSSPGQGRSVSLLPPVFVAFVPAERLLYTRRAVLEEVARRHREGRGPSSLTFITGPSRSADIENDLTIGVHGPGVVAAVIVG